jgi:hypothetical protein
MNRLKTDIFGGFPFDLDDIRWEQEAVRDAIKGMCSAFGTTFILSGCQITVNPGSVACTAGYICIGGEICKVDAHSTLTASGTIEYWAIEVSYNSLGLESFENLSSADTYEVRIAKVLSSVSPPVGAPTITSTISLDAIIKNKILTSGLFADKVSESWHMVGIFSGEPPFQDSWVNYGNPQPPCRFYKDSIGIVHLSGVVRFGTPNGIIFNLPAGYRPSYNLDFPAIAYESGIRSADTNIRVLTNGNVGLNGSNSANDYVSMEGISFKADL